MRIKKFKAKTFREALVLVKKELGNDAVILASEEQKGVFPAVEVTAAVDYDLFTACASQTQATAGWQPANESRQETTVVTTHHAQQPATTAPAAVRPDLTSPGGEESNSLLEMKKELASLRSSIEEMKLRGYEAALPEKRRKVFRYLRQKAIREDLAFRLCRSASTLRDVALKVSMAFPEGTEPAGKRVVLVIGPTGVGKTTTIAKLAARAIRDERSAALITLDTYRIGAIEQLRIYAKIMGIPLEIASSAEDLRRGLTKHASRDLVFIDTTGRNPKDEAWTRELGMVRTIGVPVETHLLVSANSDDDFLVAAYRQYRSVPIDRIGFTKVDEAVKLGALYNFSSLVGKPVGYVTNGQRVPQDIDFPTGQRLASMVLNGGMAS